MLLKILVITYLHNCPLRIHPRIHIIQLMCCMFPEKDLYSRQDMANLYCLLSLSMQLGIRILYENLSPNHLDNLQMKGLDNVSYHKWYCTHDQRYHLHHNQHLNSYHHYPDIQNLAYHKLKICNFILHKKIKKHIVSKLFSVPNVIFCKHLSLVVNK